MVTVTMVIVTLLLLWWQSVYSNDDNGDSCYDNTHVVAKEILAKWYTCMWITRNQ